MIVEILDHNLKPVNKGQKGELVFTVLGNHTMPFIRYRIGDIASRCMNSCSCGRTFSLINNLAGRLADFAICIDGKLKSPTAMIGEFDFLVDKIREFQILQKEVDYFEVQVIPKKELSTDMENYIKSTLLTEFPNTTICVKSVTKIERSASGKFKSFCAMPH